MPTPANETIVPTLEPPTEIPPTASVPSATMALEITVAPTKAPTATGGLPAGCMDALSITKAHVGETLCVSGIVGSIWNIDTDYHIIFKGATFQTIILVSFNWPPNGTGEKGFEPGDCVYLENAKITMDVERYLNAPFAPKELKRCPAQAGAAGEATKQPSVSTIAKIPDGCVNALSVTAGQVGQTLCVGGFVEQDLGYKGDYFLYFKKSSLSTLFFISLNWPKAGVIGAYPGECIYLEKATISKMGEYSIVAMFAPQDLKYCK